MAEGMTKTTMLGILYTHQIRADGLFAPIFSNPWNIWLRVTVACCARLLVRRAAWR